MILFSSFMSRIRVAGFTSSSSSSSCFGSDLQFLIDYDGAESKSSEVPRLDCFEPNPTSFQLQIWFFWGQTYVYSIFEWHNCNLMIGKLKAGGFRGDWVVQRMYKMSGRKAQRKGLCPGPIFVIRPLP
ncbi:hypothetical protein Pyn_21348 [Prunus yedoensis var. nudiflora]|uniref:Uncharacterized protein n=1 Tax=Prunus yedoensis var. nudiflora TaxID=2094558 RepID=A0A314YT59_PRUYE|nr:hypothetical protein Pyn_21348 [Prunus yedoensis var. nudiflora]